MFNLSEVLVAENVWIVGTALVISFICAQVGIFLLLKRMSLMGDAISHSVLPGVVLSYLALSSRSTAAMLGGAVLAGIATALLVEMIRERTKLKQDAAIAVTFGSLFSLGLILVSLFGQRVDLDLDCVLFGEIAFLPFGPKTELLGLPIPDQFLQLFGVAIVLSLLMKAMYRSLIMSAFDSAFAVLNLRIHPKMLHYIFSLLVAVTIVFSLESVGVILVIGQMILPAASARLLVKRIPQMFVVAAFYSVFSVGVGFVFAQWADLNYASCFVLAGSLFFAVCLLWKLLRSNKAFVESVVEDGADFRTVG